MITVKEIEAAFSDPTTCAIGRAAAGKVYEYQLKTLLDTPHTTMDVYDRTAVHLGVSIVVHHREMCRLEAENAKLKAELADLSKKLLPDGM